LWKLAKQQFILGAMQMNLAMNYVTSCCQDVKNILGLLEELYTFMNGQNDVFIKAQKHVHEMDEINS
jgi:hypothetical protein